MDSTKITGKQIIDRTVDSCTVDSDNTKTGSFSRRTMGKLAAGAILSTPLTQVISSCSVQPLSLPERDITQPDMNPYPRKSITKGGNFSTYFDQSMPNNWNYYHLDGYRESVAIFDTATRPTTMVPDAAGVPQWNPDYLQCPPTTTTVAGKFIVTYTIKPQLRYTDGSPVTWKDFYTIWAMNCGKNTQVAAATISGYSQIETVIKGNTDYEAQVIFSQPYCDWDSLFPVLYPSHCIDTPEKFNTGWLTGPPPTCGAFRLRTLNLHSEVLILERNPHWPGLPAMLDTITFYVLDFSTALAAFKNGTLDAVPVLANSDLAIISRVPNVKIQKALSGTWYFLGFNAGHNRITAELAVRQALQQAVNATLITQVMAGGFAQEIPRLGNHIYLIGEHGYVDNSIAYNPQVAGELLDSVGWKLHRDGIRYRNHKKFTVKILSRTDNFRTKLMSQLIQHDLIALGVQAIIHAVPSINFYPDYFIPGDFDLVVSGWSHTPGAISGSESIYSLFTEIDPRTHQVLLGPASAQNCGMVGSAHINELYIKAEINSHPHEQTRIANEIDRNIWSAAHSLPLYQVIEGMATVANIANYGEPLLGRIRWRDVGYVR